MSVAEKKRTDGSMALQEKQCRVITIAPAEQLQDIKLRVAAYARVSSSSDDQLNSFAAQNRYYATLISGKENWTMVLCLQYFLVISFGTKYVRNCRAAQLPAY